MLFIGLSDLPSNMSVINYASTWSKSGFWLLIWWQNSTCEFWSLSSFWNSHYLLRALVAVIRYMHFWRTRISLTASSNLGQISNAPFFVDTIERMQFWKSCSEVCFGVSTEPKFSKFLKIIVSLFEIYFPVSKICM